MSDLGEFISSHRKQQGKSIRTLAKELGISPTYLFDLESGGRSFPADARKENLLCNFIRGLALNEEKATEFRRMVDESAIEKNKVSSEVAEYLKNAPFAQQALRRAAEVKASEEIWNEFLKSLEKEDAE